MEWVVGGVAGSLFTYNRENFMFDSEQRLKREFQGQIMRIKKFELYREDVRDLMDLTVSKMDNYLIINTLQLGFCIILFTEGRPAVGKSPPWLHWLYAITTVAAFLYFVLSVWLAMHASIAAHSFGVRLLTQFVRLPVPSKEQLDNARSLATDYEAQGVGNLLRVPVLGNQLRRLNATLDTLGAADADELDSASQERSAGFENPAHAPAATLKHTQLYRQLQANWQAYDAYARVCMAMGTNQLLHAMTYYCIGMLIAENHAPFPALCCIVIFTSCAWLLVRLDLYISRRVLSLAGILLFLSPLLTILSITIDSTITSHAMKNFGSSLVPLSFLLHIAWIVFIVKLASADHFEGVALPTKFRSVLYLDVFGWLSMPDADNQSSTGNADRGDREGFSGPLSAVTEEQQERSRQVSGPGEEYPSRMSALPPHLRATLHSFCRKMTVELKRDFDRWQTPGVRSVLEGDESTLKTIQMLRARFDAMETVLQQMRLDGASGAEEVAPPVATDRDSDAITWLRLEWRAPGRSMEFFYRCDTGQTLCAKPREGSRVLDLAYMKNCVDELAEKAEALSRFAQQEASSSSGGPAVPAAREPFQSLEEAPSQLQGLASARATDRGNQLRRYVEQTAQPSTGETISPGTSSRSTPPLLMDEDDGPAQENRYGGREAVELAEGCALRENAFGHSAQAGASFHPHRQDAATAADRGLPQRKPGQMPWTTFLQGSYALIVVWSIGFLWSISFCWLGIDIPLPPVHPHTGWARAAARPDLVYAGSWPHPYFTPRAMACHEAFGPRLLLAETFAVHEISLDGAEDEGSTQALQPALLDCLSEAPEFQARGIRSISLDCSSDGSCAAILLAAAGQETLRCSLGGGSASLEGASVAQEAPALSTAHGGTWRSLAASAAVGAQAGAARDGSVWALGVDAIVQMRPRLGSVAGDLVPHFEVPHRLGHALEHLQVAGSAVVGLQSSGRLHAWPLWGGDVMAWQLPTSSRWLGFCAMERSLFLAGVSNADGSVAVWRTTLPRELRSEEDAL